MAQDADAADARQGLGGGNILRACFDRLRGGGNGGATHWRYISPGKPTVTIGAGLGKPGAAPRGRTC